MWFSWGIITYRYDCHTRYAWVPKVSICGPCSTYVTFNSWLLPACPSVVFHRLRDIEFIPLYRSCSCCMFVSSQVDLLLVHPDFLLIVPLHVLLGRCSVILSRAGCLYDPRTEIWLARPECLSFFPFIPSLLSSSSSAQVFTVTVHPSVCLHACLTLLCTPRTDDITSRAASWL